jgi:hypothetical protein
MNTVEFNLSQLVKSAQILGLPDDDIQVANEYLEYNELDLCFDTIVTQLYEYDIEIDNQFFLMVSKIANLMNLSQSHYDFMRDLVRNNSVIPKPVKEQIAEIIKSLNS